jgi:phosphopantothenoylcysteine decarboxylase/phosphopantothenate--cysteine ligase
VRFLITAGGTREYIDPVRFISNASSGKVGCSLARAALRRGHKVTLITCPTALSPPKGVKVINVETSGQMFQAVKKSFPRCDCLIMAAAVSDYTPERTSAIKLKKGKAAMTIKLKPTKDILAWAGKNKKHQTVIGFALEDKALRANAEKKLRDKNLDMIIANSTSAIGADTSTVHIKTPDSKWTKITKATKAAIAAKIIRQAESLK